MSDKNISGTTSYEQLVNPRLKSDTVRSKLAVAEENAYYNETSINNYGYEIDTEEAYPYPEECEEGFEFCKSKKKPYVQRSRSILEEDAFSEIVLTAVEARKCLNRIGQVGSGLIYAFVQIDIDHRSLTNIEEIINFKYLSFINVSHNNLNLDALDVLRELEYVVVVRADHNNVDSLCLSPMPYLQVLTLNSNRVSSLSGLKQPSLECLELNG
ncbi:leucine-rich repeat-containing protein 23-like [Aphis craccivora]|uniref:Leucine-rich repeat-containing protein 23-like n=1 Tax=Aphis craccivora TaxID=307492 RepID=A0A6G0YRY2_APHCR|nr:leucine-rich repeat-containing protein 23-like [Aphis craccivora]